jgi:hypothetical protein
LNAAAALNELRRPSMGPRRWPTWALIGIVGVVWPIVAFAALRERFRSELTEVATYPPVFVEAVAVDDQQQAAAVLEMHWSEPQEFVADLGAGRVTAVDVEAGATYQSGGVLLEIDGVGRILHVGSTPLYRPLGASDVGDDVTELRRLLVELGYLAPSEDTASPLGAGGLEAATALLRSLGASPDPSGVIDPRFFVFSPRPLSLSQVSLDVGDFVSDGPTILGGVAQDLEDVQIAVVDGDTTSNAWAGRAVEIEVADGNFALAVEQPNEWTSVELAALAALIEAGVPTIEAQVRLALPGRFAQLPGAAVVIDNSVMCVLAGTSIDALTPVRVAPVTGQLPGVVLVEKSLAGESVLANPLSLESRPACES